MSANKSFIERSVQFQEEPLVAVEVGDSSSPPDPLNVSGETNDVNVYATSECILLRILCIVA